RLPADAPLIVFALARSVGWLAHALEQISTGRLIRPRARYVGPEIGAESLPGAP
ncbi:MAG: citrate/2-methylcitrate synthase, partial [Steroidobacteraceae bacterium]